jgi:S1-C subfamily serine protease
MPASSARRALLACILAIAALPALGAEEAPAERASLGIVTRDPMDFEREMWRLEGGTWIVKVKPDGAARRAGVGPDDVIAAIDDAAIANTAALVAALGARKPGDKVRLRIIRNGRPVEMDATLGVAR